MSVRESAPEQPSQRWKFPILRFFLRRYHEWRIRHLLPLNLLLHLVGIPLALAGVVLLFLTSWYWGAGALALGYLLQWLGHLAEGNDLGEWAAVKRLLGLPYVGISPRWGEKDGPAP